MGYLPAHVFAALVKLPTLSNPKTGLSSAFLQGGPVTIDYVYDPLYRLTEANYSTGDYYHYTYDVVGNRLSQDTFVGGLPSSTAYLYDDANRLTSVNGVPYSWDNNGNLLNDGVNTYAYDSANRLKTMSNQSTASSYQYNGLNDRLQETVNGNTTTFTMDLNMGLTQALSDGTDTYIYGLGRIAQVNTGTEYFLTDALGSVRQLTDTGGAVTYASAYDPYGVTTQAFGASQTSYGFTHEYTSQGLIYLRSRTYDPSTGRFLTKDLWQGDLNRPMSYNSWLYVYANPINLTDPSGRDPWWCDSQPDPEACRDQYLPRVNARVYYLNQIGNEKGYTFGPNQNPNDEQGYLLYRVGQVVGAQNVKSIPIYKNIPLSSGLVIPGNPFCTRIEMLLEAYGLRIWSPVAASAISADLKIRPLVGGERLVIIGNSGGGTIAIESLDLLKEEGIFVDQVILRGSPAKELKLSNVGRVDYITANFFFFNLIPADYYYSFDSNPFDDVDVQEHRIDFEDPPPNHVPPNAKINKRIANLVVQLIIEGAR